MSKYLFYSMSDRGGQREQWIIILLSHFLSLSNSYLPSTWVKILGSDQTCWGPLFPSAGRNSWVPLWGRSSRTSACTEQQVGPRSNACRKRAPVSTGETVTAMKRVSDQTVIKSLLIYLADINIGRKSQIQETLFVPGGSFSLYISSMTLPER